MTGEKTLEELQSEVNRAEKWKTASQELITCLQSNAVAIKRKDDDLKENIRGQPI